MDVFQSGRVVDMKYEQNRFNTFFRTELNPDVSRLKKFASAGFYRISNGPIVCYVCKLSLGTSFLEDPFEYHKLREPHCLFVKRIANNVPMSEAVSVQLNKVCSQHILNHQKILKSELKIFSFSEFGTVFISPSRCGSTFFGFR